MNFLRDDTIVDREFYRDDAIEVAADNLAAKPVKDHGPGTGFVVTGIRKLVDDGGYN